MKSTACAMLTIILAAALVQAGKENKRPKVKFCLGPDKTKYKPGKGYTEGCTQFMCVKKGRKIKMTSYPIPDCEPEIRTTTPAITLTTTSATESVPDLTANVTAIEASMQFLNGSMEAIERKIEALQFSVESILEIMTVVQSTSKNLETKVDKNTAEIATQCDISTCTAIQNTTNQLKNCLEDISSMDCPFSKDGMTSIPDAIKANKNHLAKLQMREFLIVTSGQTGNHPDHEYPMNVEIITEDGVCNHTIPNFPVKLGYPMSAYMESKHLMTCGNAHGIDEVQCYTLEKNGINWVQLNSTFKGRHTFTMTKVGQELFAFGVHNWHAQENIAKYANGKWEELSSPLIRQRQEHCTILYKNTLVTIGGYGHTTAVEQLDLTSMTVTSNTLPNFPVNKLYRHACIVVQEDGEDVIYVTGGFLGHPDNGQKKVWKYNGGDEWELDGEMNVNRYHHTMGVLGGKLVVVGGSISFWPKPTGGIEIREKNGKWKELATGLSTPRFRHAMSLVTSSPCDFFSCKF